MSLHGPYTVYDLKTLCPMLCAPISAMGSVMGQFPLRNRVLLVVATSLLANGEYSGNDNWICRSVGGSDLMKMNENTFLNSATFTQYYSFDL